MPRTLVVAIIDHLHVVHAVGNQVAEHLVINLARELEVALVHLEVVVQSTYEVDRPLTTCLFVKSCIGNATDSGGVAQLFIERCLIVESRCEAHHEVLVPRRRDGQCHARADDGLASEVPVAHAHTVVQRVACTTLLRSVERITQIIYLWAAAEPPRVLHVGLYAVGLDPVLGTHGIDHLQVAACMGYAVAC